MAEANSLPSSPSADENQQENIKNEIVLKDSNSAVLKTRAEKVPAKEDATCLSGSPPFSTFSKEVYNQFISALKYGEPAYPTSKELRAMNFYSSKGTTHRRRFRKLLARFERHVVQGSLVFSPNLEEDVLVHKRTKKIVVPREIVDKVIRRAHLWGSNEPSESPDRKCVHYNVARTLTALGKDFTVRQREFGIDRSLVESVIFRCTSCNKGHLVSKDRIKPKQLTNRNEKTPSTGEELQPLKEAVSLPGQVLTETFGDVKQLEKARFPSMVARNPDKTCIWYDRKSIADATNKFEKLMMVIGEMRGEASLAFKGDIQAKQRLEAKLYCGQLLIKDHAKSIQKSLILEESPEVFRNELSDLEQEYTATGQAGIFSSDIKDLLTHIKTQKLILSPVIVREIEDVVKQRSDVSEPMEV